jgi:hypothetical protein
MTLERTHIYNHWAEPSYSRVVPTCETPEKLYVNFIEGVPEHGKGADDYKVSSQRQAVTKSSSNRGEAVIKSALQEWGPITSTRLKLSSSDWTLRWNYSDFQLNCQSQSQSYVTTDGQSATLSWCQAPSWDLRPDFFLSDCCGFVGVGCPLWREDGFVFYNVQCTIFTCYYINVLYIHNIYKVSVSPGCTADHALSLVASAVNYCWPLVI